MATTYTWNVSTVDTYPTHTDGNDVTENDVIFNVHWRMSADDKTNQAGSIGTIALSTSDVSSFTDFDSVTASDVEGWVISAMGEEQVQSIKDGLQNQLDEIATPTVVTRQLEA